MPPLTDPTILAQFVAALSNWNYTGYVTAKDIALDWIANNLGGFALKDIAKAMYDHIQHGSVIEQVVESRPEWSIWQFHYDFRLLIGGRDVYIETLLQHDDPKDPTIHIVSIHDV